MTLTPADLAALRAAAIAERDHPDGDSIYGLLAMLTPERVIELLRGYEELREALDIERLGEAMFRVSIGNPWTQAHVPVEGISNSQQGAQLATDFAAGVAAEYDRLTLVAIDAQPNAGFKSLIPEGTCVACWHPLHEGKCTARDEPPYGSNEWPCGCDESVTEEQRGERVVSAPTQESLRRSRAAVEALMADIVEPDNRAWLVQELSDIDRLLAAIDAHALPGHDREACWTCTPTTALEAGRE